MAEEIRTELVADATKHTAGVNRAKKDAQEFGQQWDKTAKQQVASSASVRTSTDQQARAFEGLARESKGLAGDLASLSRGGGDLGQKMASASFSVGQLGEAVGNLGGRQIGPLIGNLGIIGTMVASTVVAFRALADAAGANEIEFAQTTEEITKATKALEAFEAQTLAAQKAIAAGEAKREQAAIGGVGSGEDVDLADLDRRNAAAASRKRQAQFQDVIAGRTKVAPKAAKDGGGGGGGFDRAAFDEKERQAAIASADKLTADLIKNEEKQRAAIANLDKIAADNKKALADVAAAEDDRARAARIAKAKAEIAEIDNARAASAAANANFAAAAGVKEGGAGMTLGMALFGQDDPHGNQTLDATNNMAIAVATVGDAAASAAEQLAAVAIGTVMEAAIGPSVKYVETQEQLTRGMFKTEQAFKNAQKAQKGAAAAEKASQLTTGETLKVAVRDTLKAIAIKAALEGAFKLAAAIFPPNPALASSGAALLAVAAAAGGAAAAIGPVTKTRPGGGGVPRDQASATGGGVGVGAKEGPVTQTVNVTVYTLPGTEANGVYEGIERGMNRARRERGKKELAA